MTAGIGVGFSSSEYVETERNGIVQVFVRLFSDVSLDRDVDVTLEVQTGDGKS